MLTTTNWIFLAAGVLLLLWPADRLLSQKVELRSFDSFRTLQDSPRHRPWWWVPLLWLDPLRSFGGTWLLRYAFDLRNLAAPVASGVVYGTMIGVLVVAMLSQLFTRRERDALLAPVGFSAGIVAALVPWPVALLGLTAALASMFAFRSFLGFFNTSILGLALLGLVLEAPIAGLAPALGLLTLPILMCFFTRSTLELPTRNETGHRGLSSGVAGASETLAPQERSPSSPATGKLADPDGNH